MSSIQRSLHLPRIAAVAALAIAAFGPAPVVAQSDEITKAPSEAPPTTVVGLVRFRGTYLDLAEQNGDLSGLLLGTGAKPKDFYAVCTALEEAAVAEEYSTLLLDLTHPFSMNRVQLQEIARTLRSIREAGKKTVAYLENSSTANYVLAACCDEVVMADLGVVELAAPAMSILFLRDAMDLLGVRMDVVRCGDFKGAVEPYLNSRMSDHLREHYRAMLERINSHIVAHLAEHRGMPAETIRDLQSKRLVTAQEAHDAKLVDTLSPWVGAEAMMRARIEGDVEFKKVLRRKGRRSGSFNVFAELGRLFSSKPRDETLEEPSIVVLHLSGTIVDGHKAAPGSIVSGPTVKTIRGLTEDAHAAAVVVRINSPGGSATASEAILLALKELADKKPVVVSMGSVAASGGYYVTCLGRPIYAEAATITGSIGVFGMKPALGPLFRRIGLREEIIGLDESASMASLTRPWSEAQKVTMQAFVDRIYDRFVRHVASSRGLTSEGVLPIAGGRVWSGEQAREIGLVDHIGGLDDAIAHAAKDAQIEEFEIIHRPQPVDFFEALAQEMINARLALPLDSLPVRWALERGQLEQALQVLAATLGHSPATVWALAPDITVR